MASKNWADISHLNGLTQRELAFCLHSRCFPSLETHSPSLNCINILHHNSQYAVQKIDKYNCLQNIGCYHVVSLSETWFSSKLPDCLINLNVLTAYCKDRACKNKSIGGGAALYIRNDLEHNSLPQFTPPPTSSFDAVWVKLQFGKKDQINCY